jgi:hypothetical protein
MYTGYHHLGMDEVEGMSWKSEPAIYINLTFQVLILKEVTHVRFKSSTCKNTFSGTSGGDIIGFISIPITFHQAKVSLY